MNETFGSIKVYRLTTNNQPINSILQISNFVGQAQFTKNMACTGLISDDLDSQIGTITGLVGDQMTIPTIVVANSVELANVSGVLTAPYMNMSTSADKGLYLYETRGFLEFQKTAGLSITGSQVNASTTDSIANISGWKKILEPTSVVAPAPTDLSGLIRTVNELIQAFADRGFLVTTRPLTPVITGVTVDISGFYVSWSPPTVATLSIDGLVYNSSANSPYFIPIATTNTFYYSLKVGNSQPFLAALCNINNSPTDLNNYYPTYGLSPSTLAYYRATIPGQVNYIILSIEKNPLSGNVVFFMKGSNASPTTPISFMYYSRNIYGSAYLPAGITLTDPGRHVLTYNYALDSWSLYS